MSDQRLILRASMKLLAGIALLWLGYIFLVGLLGSNDTGKQKTHRFDISSIGENQASHLDIEGRELLVIHRQQQFFVYWADDPVYGCKLEYRADSIKPVCTNIEYQLNGNGPSGINLKSPEYRISGNWLTVVR